MRDCFAPCLTNLLALSFLTMFYQPLGIVVRFELKVLMVSSSQELLVEDYGSLLGGAHRDGDMGKA